ncbi:MAG: FAD-dependent oxidoreductase [Clostridia bacterium]|nr:FAD-dependent oxidoreductase [Clostridia bacterium]
MNTLNINKQADIIGNYQVTVCGGGPSGFIAAIAAARCGASVALIERYGYLGGMATAGMVAPISEFMHEGELISSGIPLEFVKRIDGGKMCSPRGNFVFHPEEYKIAAQRMVFEAGVDLYLHAYVTDCVMDDGKITHIVFESKSGTQAIATDYVIDATGDGDIAYKAGVPMQNYNTPLQPATMYFALNKVDTSGFKGYYPGQKHSSIPEIREMLSKLCPDAPQMGGPWCFAGMGEGTAIINMSRTALDWLDEKAATKAECKLREDIKTIVHLLKTHIPAFKNAELLMSAPQVGIRETRHIKGTHILTGDEYVNAVHFEDSVARCSHPIDIHSTNDNTQTVTPLKQAAYLPYRSIIADGYNNLLVPSRCFSADREAFASARVQVGVMGLGQAAGVAAAQCAEKHLSVHNADIKKLRKVLADWGMKI